MADSFTVTGVSIDEAKFNVRDFLDDKFDEDAEIMRSSSDKPLIKAGVHEVVIRDRGDHIQVQFTPIELTMEELEDVVTRGRSHSSANQAVTRTEVDLTERENGPPLFDIVMYRGQIAIVRQGKSVAGEVLSSGWELPDALEEVFQESGLDEDDLVTVFKPNRAEPLNINPTVRPDDVAEGLLLAALETPGMASAILNIKDDDPDKTFEGVGDPSQRDFVVKPFSKEQARYRERSDRQFDDTHPKCKDCAHFDGHGNCMIVPNIEPDEYCEEFYADAGVFADKTGTPTGDVDVNLTILGEMFDWTDSEIAEFGRMVEAELKQ